MRSYDSRKEPAPDYECTIWQAGRATCAIGLAFKPIQIGQHVFIDEGVGRYNPAPQILDEAAINEYPGREVGVFISIGTGKRPPGTAQKQAEWWEGFCGGTVGDFAEARRRLIAKIEGCEDTHKYMLKEHLAKRNVNPESYYRLNVEVGVGEFGMNEWNRVSDISTNTRMYLSRSEVQKMTLEAAAKIARIHFAKVRYQRMMNGEPPVDAAARWSLSPLQERRLPAVPPPPTFAVELPGEDVVRPPGPRAMTSTERLSPQYQYQRFPSIDEKFAAVSSDEFPQPVSSLDPRPLSPPRNSAELAGSEFRSSSDYPPQYLDQRRHSGSPPRFSGDYPSIPPPLPPKTPIQYADEQDHNPSWQQQQYYRPPGGVFLPYPDTDGPPPAVNMARKPDFGIRQ